jgi:predicted RNA-binding protein with PIN domain
VDARNVLRSRWPNIPEDTLAGACCRWAKEAGVHALVVFDGRAPGGLVGERDADPYCRLVGTGKETADDWIKRAAIGLGDRGEAYWLVTSDRALREAAGRQAVRTIGGGSFARELGAYGANEL